MQAGECHVHSAVLKSSYLCPMKPGQICKLILSPTTFPPQFPNSGTQSLLNFLKLQQGQFRVILLKRILLIRRVGTSLLALDSGGQHETSSNIWVPIDLHSVCTSRTSTA